MSRIKNEFKSLRSHKLKDSKRQTANLMESLSDTAFEQQQFSDEKKFENDGSNKTQAVFGSRKIQILPEMTGSEFQNKVKQKTPFDTAHGRSQSIPSQII